MNIKKFRQLLEDYLMSYELYDKYDIGDCINIELVISYLGKYVLNWSKDKEPEVAFAERDIDGLMEDIISLLKDSK